MENKHYDIALSFAEDQRDYAAAVDGILSNQGYSCYYYCYQGNEVLGSNLKSRLQEVYGQRSTVIIVFVSPIYFTKPYCMAEWEAISERYTKEPRILIPVLCADNKDPVVEKIADLAYYLWDKDPRALCALALERLEELQGFRFEQRVEQLEAMDMSQLRNYFQQLQGITETQRAKQPHLQKNHALAMSILYTKGGPDYGVLRTLSLAFKASPHDPDILHYFLKSKFKKAPIASVTLVDMRRYSDKVFSLLSLHPGHQGLKDVLLHMHHEYFAPLGITLLK